MKSRKIDKKRDPKIDAKKRENPAKSVQDFEKISTWPGYPIDYVYEAEYLQDTYLYRQNTY